MNQESLTKILMQVQLGESSVEEALEKLRNYPYENIGDFVRLDHHRSLRCGHPEIIFGVGKTIDQLVAITKKVLDQNDDLMITRIEAEISNQIREIYPQIEYHPLAKMLTWQQNPEKGIGNVLVLTGGTADIPVAEESALTAEMMGAKVTRLFDVGVAGLHRLLDQLKLIQQATVLVVVAGMEGALPSVVAGLVSAPVIAVPTSIGYGASFNGLAALLAMLNSCANGVSVVNIDNGFGAGYQAALINRQSGGNQKT
jgi:hypothetical protein